jgi:hypothetical protein
VCGLLLVVHVTHLVGDIFDPGLGTLHPRDHCSELRSDDSLGYQRFSKHLSLSRPSCLESGMSKLLAIKGLLKALLDDASLSCYTAASHTPPKARCHKKHRHSCGDGNTPFVVKIAQYNLQSAIIIPQGVLIWDMNIFESNIRSTSSCGIWRFDLLRFDTRSALYDKYNHPPFVSAATYCKVVRKSSIGNPFLFWYVSDQRKVSVLNASPY